MKNSIEDRIKEVSQLAAVNGYNVVKVGKEQFLKRAYSRRDYYKISLVHGKIRLYYDYGVFEHEGMLLFFGNPDNQYMWETISMVESGYFCLFSESFLQGSSELKHKHILDSPLFNIGIDPVVKLEEEQYHCFREIFDKMCNGQESDYLLKADMVRNYIDLIFHEAVKINK